ncbi:MAG: PIN domain-containing protein [Candidatus Hydrothermarchaeales archaeon]
MDTNFLMTPAQFNVDVFGELARLIDVSYELFVPDLVVKELQTLAKKGPLKNRKAARVALGLARGIKTIKVEGNNPDEAILSITDKKTVVCTNDKKLRERVMKKGGKVVFLRQKRILQLEGGDVGIS